MKGVGEMLYLVAILCPPLAVLFCGKLFQAILNVGLTAMFYVPGLIHAICVVNNRNEDKRTKRIVESLGTIVTRMVEPNGNVVFIERPLHRRSGR